MAPISFSPVNFEKRDFIANDPLAGAVSNAVANFLAARQAQADYKGKLLANEYLDRQTLEEYARPGDIVVDLMRQRAGLEPPIPADLPADATGGLPGLGLPATGAPVMAPLPAPGIDPAPDLLGENAVPALPANVQAPPPGPPTGGTPVPGKGVPDTLAPDAGMPATPELIGQPADAFDEEFEGAYDVSLKTKQQISAFIGQHGRAAVDALAQYARFTPAEIDMAAKEQYTPQMVMKLAEVPGGRITSLPGTKTREAQQQKMDLEEQKLQARIAKDAANLQGKADERSIKLFKILSQNIASTRDYVWLNNILAKGDPKRMMTVAGQAEEFNKNILPQFQAIADGMDIRLDAKVLDQYYNSLQGELLRKASAEGDSASMQTVIDFIAGAKGAALKVLGSGAQAPVSGEGKPTDKPKGPSPEAVQEATASVEKMVKGGMSRQQAVAKVLSTNFAKQNGLTSANLR